jgi:hypothetical protein
MPKITLSTKSHPKIYSSAPSYSAFLATQLSPTIPTARTLPLYLCSPGFHDTWIWWELMEIKLKNEECVKLLDIEQEDRRESNP